MKERIKFNKLELDCADSLGYYATIWIPIGSKLDQYIDNLDDDVDLNKVITRGELTLEY